MLPVSEYRGYNWNWIQQNDYRTQDSYIYVTEITSQFLQCGSQSWIPRALELIEDPGKRTEQYRHVVNRDNSEHCPIESMWYTSTGNRQLRENTLISSTDGGARRDDSIRPLGTRNLQSLSPVFFHRLSLRNQVCIQLSVSATPVGS